MHRTLNMVAALALALLLAAPSRAAVEFCYDEAADLYVRTKLTSSTSAAAALVEGTSGAAGFYSAADGTLGLTTRGVYSATIFAGATPSTTAADPQVGTVTIYWSGTACVTPAEYLLTAPTAAGAAGTLERAWHNLRLAFGAADDGTYAAAALENAPAGEGGGAATPVAADDVSTNRTWTAGPDGAHAANVVTVIAPFGGPLAAVPDLNEGVDINTVDSVTIVGPEVDEEPIEIEAASLRKSPDGRKALFDAALLTVQGDYRVVVTVSALDSEGPLSLECVLQVR